MFSRAWWAVICWSSRRISQTFRWLAMAALSQSYCSRLKATVTVLGPTRLDH